jgi:hypothetical protein
LADGFSKSLGRETLAAGWDLDRRERGSLGRAVSLAELGLGAAAFSAETLGLAQDRRAIGDPEPAGNSAGYRQARMALAHLSEVGNRGKADREAGK